MLLFLFFMKRSCAATRNARICLKPTSPSNMLRARKGFSRTYQTVVNELLDTYAAYTSSSIMNTS